jgi:hypothetical protein
VDNDDDTLTLLMSMLHKWIWCRCFRQNLMKAWKQAGGQFLNKWTDPTFVAHRSHFGRDSFSVAHVVSHFVPTS